MKPVEMDLTLGGEVFNLQFYQVHAIEEVDGIRSEMKSGTSFKWLTSKRYLKRIRSRIEIDLKSDALVADTALFVVGFAQLNRNLYLDLIRLLGFYETKIEERVMCDIGRILDFESQRDVHLYQISDRTVIFEFPEGGNQPLCASSLEIIDGLEKDVYRLKEPPRLLADRRLNWERKNFFSIGGV